MRSHLIAVWLLLAAIVLASPVYGQDIGEETGIRIRDVTQGSLLFRTEQKELYLPVPILKTDVEMKVTGLILRATVSQRFKNPSPEWAEGVYVFPLPENAAVDHLRMRIGERIIEGMIKERAEAKQTYEKAKTEGRRASLLEQERPNIFTASVANIGPGDEITVELEYQQVLHYDQGLFRLRFPMVVGPRYIPGSPQSVYEDGKNGYGWGRNTDSVPDASRITPPVLHPSKGLINPVSLKIDLAPGFPLAQLESAYHKIHVAPERDGRYSVTLQGNAVPANRDFELWWQPAAGKAPAVALFSEPKDGEIFGLFMVMPPASSSLHQHRLPRDMIFVIDTSGSMAGHSIEQAKAALTLALARLLPDDTFNIIQFNSWTQALFAGSMPATKTNYEKAVRYVSSLTAQGGTEMRPALKRALEEADTHGRLRQIVFLTDGAVGNEEELFNLIRQHLRESRLFTIGIGSAPNSHFMRNAAAFGRGTFTYIGSTTEVQDKMDALFRKLEHPALTEIRLDLPSSAKAEILPDRIPDLYLGEPFMVVVKAKSLPDHVILQGRLGTAPWKTDLSLENVAPREGLSVHWARQKIASLMDQRTSGIENDTVRRAVIEVALRHHLVSQYTSLVAVDITPVRPEDRNLTSHAMKTNLPEGWDYTSVFGLPQTATDGHARVLLGFFVLLLAALFWNMRRQQA